MKWMFSVSFIFLTLVFFSGFADAQPPGKEKPVVHEIDIDNIPQDHDQQPPVQIHLRRQDSVVWFSTSRFKITKVLPADSAKDPVFWFPFYRDVKTMISVKGNDGIHRVSVGVARSELGYDMAGETYKPFFQKLKADGTPDGPEIDPHISIHPDR